jgi:uncharacterized phage protein
MSDKAIELFIRMHLEKTPTLQRGQKVLTGDVIMAVLGAIQHQQPFGCDLLSAKWLNDSSAMVRIEQRIIQWAIEPHSSRPDLLIQVGTIALAIFCGKSTADQHRKLVSLWKQFSEQGHRSNRLIKRYQTQINFLNNQLCETEFRQAQIDQDILKLETLIDNERVRLDAWAHTQAKTSYICPKCHGSGFSKSTNDCNECGGSGYFLPRAENVRKHLVKTGVSRISDKLWNSDIKPRFDELVMMLQREHDETARLLGKRLGEERVA